MQRVALSERPDWKAKAEEAGFNFHTMHGEPYWDETSAYQFSLAEIEDEIEDPATALHGMCREAVDMVIRSEELLTRLDIPRAHWEFIADSWHRNEPELYGRFDLIYSGDGPAKMIEYNADTPTSLFESASFQWGWLEDMAASLGPEADQFNSIFEALTERFAEMFPTGTHLHFACFTQNAEDLGTVETVAWAARGAEMGAHLVDIAKIGMTETGQLADDESRVIGTLFKLYPWEDMLRDDFAKHLAGANCRFLEPAWKAVVSNKGILPVLWEMFEGHPNLLPAFFEDRANDSNPVFRRSADAMQRGFVRKPIFSREGSSVTITENGQITDRSPDQTYAGQSAIVQAYCPMPDFDGFRPVLGAWIIGTTCRGLGMREDRSRITQNLSRFKPHFITG